MKQISGNIITNWILILASIGGGASYWKLSGEIRELKLQGITLAESKSTDHHEFVMVQLSNYRRDQFMYDKKTGRVWASRCSDKECNSTIWTRENVEGIE